MADEQLSEELRQLIARFLPSMDHVAVLVALHATASQSHTARDIAAMVRMTETLTRSVLSGLEDAGLSEREGKEHRFASSSPHAETVTQLTEMYNSRPVTLVRAVYDRPASAARSFADAFRIRKADG